jgi:hypothetical protein
MMLGSRRVDSKIELTPTVIGGSCAGGDFLENMSNQLSLQRQIIKNPTLTLPLKVRGFLGFFPLSWAGSPIPPLSRGRLGGGWGKYVAVVL